MIDWHLNGYGQYVWPAYGICLGLIAALVVASWHKHRRLLSTLRDKLDTA